MNVPATMLAGATGRDFEHLRDQADRFGCRFGLGTALALVVLARISMGSAGVCMLWPRRRFALEQAMSLSR